jgi:hypothetical protein
MRAVRQTIEEQMDELLRTQEYLEDSPTPLRCFELSLDELGLLLRQRKALGGSPELKLNGGSVDASVTLKTALRGELRYRGVLVLCTEELRTWVKEQAI